MIVECKDNSGFEDVLTADKLYHVERVGENSYLLIDDRRRVRWYGTQHFRIKGTLA